MFFTQRVKQGIHLPKQKYTAWEGTYMSIHNKISKNIRRKKFELVYTNERLITPGGLSIVGGLLEKSEFVRCSNRVPVEPKRSEPQIKNGDILLAYIGLLCQGKTAYEAVEEMRDDPDFYKDALGIKRGIPSAETLRQRMDDIGDSLRESILQGNACMFSSHNVEPGALPNGYVPVDIDVTPFDNSKTSKEGVSRTYKGYDGYAPIMAYIGTEGFMANCELREGKQHCQKGTPQFLRETLSLCHRVTEKPLLVRMDAGNDAADNIGILAEDGDRFIIKRNLRKESKDAWLENAKETCRDIRRPREGKTVYVGTSWKDVAYEDADKKKKTIRVRVGYEIIERTIDKKGQTLIFPDIEANTWWTNLEWTDDEIIAAYHAHGESEQYHSELKTDMDVERLPSGKFGTNALVLELAMIAYNILRMIGQESLKHKQAEKRPVKRRRIRTVLSNLIQFAIHVTNHARKVFLGMGRSNTWRYAFNLVWQRFACG